MKELVTLNKEELKRSMVLNRVQRGEMSRMGAAEVLGVSVRHLKRILAAYRKEGAEALAHGNRGKTPCNTLATGTKERVAELAQSTYSGCNQQHLTELLAEREGIILSRSTVRRFLIEEGINSPRKRRPPKHRSRRERRAQRGMLLQIDGSDHDWLQGRGPRLTLVGAIDDATGEVSYALFREEEDTQGYFLLLRHIVRNYGIPLAIYHDRHGIFERSPKDKESLEEELEGKRYPTQFGRVMEDLGITSISASSPQAKGRIERLWGTFQDRLVSELRLAGASAIQEANQVLWDFLPRHNQKFTVAASLPGSAYRKPGRGFKPDEVFCFKYRRTVGRDNVVRFGEHRFQIGPDAHKHTYADARVEVHERLDGSVVVYYQGRCLATSPAPPEAPLLRARNSPRVMPNQTEPPQTSVATAPASNTPEPRQPHHPKPAPNHPWRRGFKLHLDRG
ncbi:MAG: ISNCY family transposase [Chloroflexi bacterium]|nr:ISNCY family transposase [Chloroflexota bacterium]